MNFELGEIITVTDAGSDVEVPAIVTGISEDGETANIQVFGSSDVIEKRVVTSADFESDEDDSDNFEIREATPIAEPATTGTRRASATTTNEGDK